MGKGQEKVVLVEKGLDKEVQGDEEIMGSKDIQGETQVQGENEENREVKMDLGEGEEETVKEAWGKTAEGQEKEKGNEGRTRRRSGERIRVRSRKGSLDENMGGEDILCHHKLKNPQVGKACRVYSKAFNVPSFGYCISCKA